jgi:anti-sigma factor RsiW
MKDSRAKTDTLVIDELLIDELVAGELKGERYREVVRALDAQPAKWRDCALAFLEEQALRNELRSLAQGTIDWSTDATSEKTEPTVAAPEPARASQSTPSPASGQSSTRFTNFLSTAALLLVSFTVGWLGSEVIAERQLTSSDSGTSSIVQKPTLPSTDTNPVVSPSLDTQFVVDRPGSFDRGIPRSIRELEHDGRINVKTFDMVVPTTFADGSSGYVPVQHMILSPRRLDSY